MRFFKKEKLGFLINPTDYQAIWHVINDDYELKKCKNCGMYTRFNRQFFYHETCSRKCSSIISGNKDQEERRKIIEKSKITYLIKYGVVSQSKEAQFKPRIKKTNIEKYGADSPMKNPDIKNKQFKKMQETNLKKYGVKSTLSNLETKEKIRNSMLNKYGVDHPYLEIREFLIRICRINLLPFLPDSISVAIFYTSQCISSFVNFIY